LGSFLWWCEGLVLRQRFCEAKYRSRKGRGARTRADARIEHGRTDKGRSPLVLSPRPNIDVQ